MSPDSWQLTFFAAAGLLILLQAWRGWRLGVVRQVVGLLALGAAYAAAIFGRGLLVPVLRPIGWPDPALAILSGVLLGTGVYFVITIVGAVLFKKTSQQSIGLIRFGYGAAGSLLGAVFGLFLVWIFVLAIRVLGTIAESEVQMTHLQPTPERGARSRSKPSAPEPKAVVLGLAHMKQSLEQGAAGAVVQQIDPIPESIYGILGKLGLMASDAKRVERFLTYPGVKPLVNHPKIIALRDDPQIAREVIARDFFALLRNDRIVAAANDAEIAALMRKFEFEKALDYAIGGVTPRRE